MLTPPLFAANLGSEKSLRDRHLHGNDSFVTMLWPRRAWIGATVEFWTRANAGSAADALDG
jgi:hypothetical protein